MPEKIDTHVPVDIHNFVYPLPYDQNALSPYISETTVREHYEMHHKGYAATLRSNFPEYKHLIDAINADNFAAKQIFNHNFLWKSLKPNCGREDFDEIKYGITYDDLISKIIHAGKVHIGSGWIWIIENHSIDRTAIDIITTSDGDIIKLTTNQTILCCNDIWEHAYYIDYHSKKAEYLRSSTEHLSNWHVELDELEKQVFYRT